MRLSSSLQDLSTFSKVDTVERSSLLDKDWSYSRADTLHTLQREGGGSSFSKEKSSPGSPTKRKKWVRATIGAILLLLLFFLIYACSRYFGTSSHGSSNYFVVLDCGSTGTRVYVYEWSVDQTKGTNIPIALRSLPKVPQKKSDAHSGRAYQRMETEPGFDKLVRNQSGLSNAIKPLLKWAEKQIPKHAHKHTPLFLYATAGVRRLPRSDSVWLLDKAWSLLKNSSFLCSRDKVKIISGMEEAYYGWIALNHDMGTFDTWPSKMTFGSLDLGGSSLQVTFETGKAVQDDTSVSLRIGSASHHLSAYSLSGYGLNDAFDKSVAHLLRRLEGVTTATNNGKMQVRHPCLQAGYREDYICSYCVALNQEGSPLIGERLMGKGHTGTVIELLGAPQWQECSALAKTTVDLSAWSNASSKVDCELKPCALRDSLPRPSGQFYAMSGFFVVFRFFNLTSEASLVDVLKKGKEFCGKPWEVAKRSVVPQPFIEQYCFRAPYIASLLRDGLHIEDDQVVIGSGSITWTLGVALLEAGQALSDTVEFQSYRILHTDIDSHILFVLLFASVMVLLCALSCVNNWLPKVFRRSYLPLLRQNSAANSMLNMASPFRFRLWSPINSGDARTKMPLSPTVAASQQHPFSMGHGLGATVMQLSESSMQPLGVSHSFSAGNLGQMQFFNGFGSFYKPHRGQTTLQSRRSQSREDLTATLTELHIAKV